MIIWLDWKTFTYDAFVNRNMLSLCFLTWKKRMTPLGSMAFYNSNMNCLDPKTNGLLYVDDFCMCYRSKSMRTIERHLQQCINRIENWALHNGFKYSKSKTQCVHFCQLRKVHNDPELYLYGSPFLLSMILNF